MNGRNLLWAAASALAFAAAGCIGSVEPIDNGTPPADNTPDEGADAGVAPIPDPSAGTPQALFEANVYPIVTAACSPAGACHSTQDPAFVRPTAADTYTTIKAFRDSMFPGYESDGARLLINGEGTHQGAVYPDTGIEHIESWLAAERLETVGEVSPLAAWSGCMNLEEWNAEQVAPGWANKNAQGQGNCEACHNLGADGFMASDQSERVFESITTIPSLMPSYFTIDAATQTVIINRARLENVGNRNPPHEAHGGFDVDGNAMERLQRFYDLTVARAAAGLCDPPRFPQ